MRKVVVVLFFVVLFLVSCEFEQSEGDTLNMYAPDIEVPEEPLDLPSDDPTRIVLGEGNSPTGEGYADLTPKQKRAYWGCFTSPQGKSQKSCRDLYLSSKSKRGKRNYRLYLSCAKACFAKATQVTEAFCSDSDGPKFDEKGHITTDDFVYGCTKSGDYYVCEDFCHTFRSGSTYLFERSCNGDSPHWQQKRCTDLRDNFKCLDGACVSSTIHLSSADLGEEFPLSYEDNFVNENGMRIHFDYDDEGLLVYSTIDFEGEEHLLDYQEYSTYPMYHQFYNVYSEGEVIRIGHFDDSSVTVALENDCSDEYPYCNFIAENFEDYHLSGDSELQQYFDPELFSSPEVMREYTERSAQVNKESIEYLKERLGIEPPVDTFFQFISHNPSAPGGSHSSGFLISTNLKSQIADDKAATLQYGQTHELVHVFVYGTPVIRTWFEEGLADYMERSQTGQSGLFCYDDGWQWGYYDSTGQFVENSPFVAYSDFMLPPQVTSDFYDPLNKPSYYKSGECFWAYIEDTYGQEGLQQIMHEWDATRQGDFTDEKWLIRDIVNPVLGVDLSGFVYERYEYVEE